MITIENGRVLYGENMEIIEGNVIIDDDKIIEVTKNLRKGKKIDAKGCIVAPAFINSHVHIGDSVALDVGDGKSIEKIVKPPHGLKHRILRKTPKSKIIESMRRSMIEMLKRGTTTFVDFREGGFEGLNLIHEAGENTPIRKIVLGRHESFFDADAKKAYVRKIIKKLLRECNGIAISGFAEIRDDLASMITDACHRQDKISAIHVAEYEGLQKDSLKETSKTEVERAIKAGFDLLVHLTAPMGNDLKLIAESGKSVVICPRSNGILSCGIPPIRDMFEEGINILLGTDNVMFNSPDMLREMEYALKVTRGYYREYFPPLEMFKTATLNAARALNLNLGCIKEGKIADIMVVEQISEDPILSLINRTESKNIICVITEGNIVFGG